MPITYDTGSANTLGSNSTTVTTGSITTAENDELLVAFGFLADNTNSNSAVAATSPSVSSGTPQAQVTTIAKDAWGEQTDISTTTGADTASFIAHAVKSSAGSTGTLQYTAGISSRHGMIVAAFKLPKSLPPNRLARAFPMPILNF